MPGYVTFRKSVAKSPYLVIVTIIVIAIWTGHWWVLAGLPMVWLGWVCATPNFNLASGCLVQVAGIVGVVLMAVFSWRACGVAAGAGWATWVMCSAELAWRCETGRTGVPQAPIETNLGESTEGNEHE
jgi:hypothetical protein